MSINKTRSKSPSPMNEQQQRQKQPETQKTMLILKSNPAALGTVENFLRNRGWKIYSTSNMKEALVQLVQQKPDYVLVGLDNPNKKAISLPKVLAQAFPVAVIVFAEQANTLNFILLGEAFTDYKVYPPVTGPAIERCVHKYVKDQQAKLASKSAVESFNSDGPDFKDKNDVISVRGGQSGTATTGRFDTGYGGENASRLLSQLLGEELPPIANVSGAADKPAASSDQIFARASVDDDGAEGSGNTQIRTDAQVQKGVAGKINTFVPTSSGPESMSAHQKGTNAKTMSALSQTPGAPSSNPYYDNDAADANPNSTQQQSAGSPAASGEPLGSREYRRSHAAPSWAPMEERKSRIIKETGDYSDDHTLISIGTQKSLEESSVNVPGPVQKIEASTNVACIVIESERFSGYLVAAMGKDRTIDPEFVKVIKRRLFKFLKENGEELNEEDTMGIKIKQVDFEPWALEYAEFLRKSVHQGNEFAMAFFPRKSAKTAIEDSAHHEMAKLDIKELQGDTEVMFDLYVYLPANNKYVLYTPKGGVFYTKQMDRLQQQGITHMHIQKDAVRDVSKYRAQTYLNALVDNFDQKNDEAKRSA